MIEEQQVVSSTAQLDSPQETAAEEVNVVNESPSEEGGSDNMSLNELTTQLLVEDEKQEESGESEVEQTTEEETPLQTEPEAEEQPNLVEQADEGENDERQVLERYGIDLDNLGEDDAMSLGKALRTESLKRFGRLTAQKREAEAKIAELEGKATTVTESRVTQEDDPLSDVWTAETLQKKETDLQTIEDWAEDSLQLEAQYDDDGEEYLVETDGKKYTKQDLLGIRSNARKMLRKGGALDKRSQFLADRQNFDGQALQFFPWMSDESSPEYGEYQQFVTQEKYKKILDSIPEANVFAGLVVEGNLRVRERNAKTSNGNGKAPKERAVTPALADAAAPKRATSGDNSRIQKQVKQARQNFERSGSIAALATLRELQGKMS
tara:strand:+ start:715 stop:1854 length:1140 start_codon:yes stop_codon:yes gene_type:complete